jgi:hypothetical protein
MVLRRIFPAFVGAALLVAGGASSMAADYPGNEFLNLDLSKAVLSPKRLGPPAEFTPVPLRETDVAKDVVKNDPAKNSAAKDGVTKDDVARSDAAKVDVPKSDVATAAHSAEPAQSKLAHRVNPHRGSVLAHAQVEKPRGAARTRLAHRGGNPLDAQARDTHIQPHHIQPHHIQPHHIQAWPCTSGGICDWKQ